MLFHEPIFEVRSRYLFFYKPFLFVVSLKLLGWKSQKLILLTLKKQHYAFSQSWHAPRILSHKSRVEEPLYFGQWRATAPTTFTPKCHTSPLAVTLWVFLLFHVFAEVSPATVRPSPSSLQRSPTQRGSSRGHLRRWPRVRSYSDSPVRSCLRLYGCSLLLSPAQLHRCTFVVRFFASPACFFFCIVLHNFSGVLRCFLRDFRRSKRCFIFKGSVHIRVLTATHSNTSSSSNPVTGSKTSRFCRGSCGVGIASNNSRFLSNFCSRCTAPSKLSASCVSSAAQARGGGNCWDHTIAVPDSLCCVQLH